MIKDTQTLNSEFMDQFYEFDKTKKKYILFEKIGLFPAFYYCAEDYAILIEDSKGVLLPITFEITTFGKLKQWLDLMFQVTPDY